MKEMQVLQSAAAAEDVSSPIKRSKVSTCASRFAAYEDCSDDRGTDEAEVDPVEKELNEYVELNEEKANLWLDSVFNFWFRNEPTVTSLQNCKCLSPSVQFSLIPNVLMHAQI